MTKQSTHITIHDGVSISGSQYVDLQRAALAAVLELSTESTRPAVDEISNNYRRCCAAAQEEFEAATCELEQRFAGLRAEARRQYEELIQDVEQRFESELTRAHDNIRTARDYVDGELKLIEIEARKVLDNEILMADTIVRSTIRGLHKEAKQAETTVAMLRQRPAALHDLAEWYVQHYKLKRNVKTAPDLPAELHTEPMAVFNRHYLLGERLLAQITGLSAPRLLQGFQLFMIIFCCCALAVGLMAAVDWADVPYWPNLYVTASAAVVITLVASVLFSRKLLRAGLNKAQSFYDEFCWALLIANASLDEWLKQTQVRLKQEEAHAVQQRNKEVQSARKTYRAELNQARQRLTDSIQKIEDTSGKLQEEIQKRRASGLVEADTLRQNIDPRQQAEFDELMTAAQRQYKQRIAACRKAHENALDDMYRRWDSGLDSIRDLLAASESLQLIEPIDWHDDSIRHWQPPETAAPVIPFGNWRVSLDGIDQEVRRRGEFLEQAPAQLDVPAVLAFPSCGSLALQSDGQSRSRATAILKVVMLRLLTLLPPGRSRLTIIDPLGLGESFAGLMHLTDYDDALVGSRIWTEAADIEQRLIDLTTQMENIIQKYLRNEFQTIGEYNAQAGMLAEPYRFVVISDFPTNFSVDAARRLISIINSGARCGVYALLAYDVRQKLPPGIHLEDLTSGCVHLALSEGQSRWQDEVRGQYELSVDVPPAEGQLTEVMHAVGQAAQHSMRVEVPFEKIAPPAEKLWSSTCDQELRIPIGLTGATRKQRFSLGKGVAQHALVAGKTGSGKSTLFHVMITNTALWYGPDQVEMYLVDFKKGVEFKTYATHYLPHARVVAIESDREFGLSVLQKLDAELSRRGDLFRRAGAADLASYRQAAGEPLARTLLIVDEFQMLFAEDDKLAQDAAILLDRLVRQGRAFGIHAILGSQTLGGTSRLSRSTVGQMAVRVALMCSEADSLLILDDNNNAAKLLSRPGEAIYNDAGGLSDGNSLFQTAWLPEEVRDRCLERVALEADRRECAPRKTVVFEGNAPADLAELAPLAELLDAQQWPKSPQDPRIWLGDPVAIKEPTHVVMRNQSGANLLMVGQREDSALAMMAGAMVALAAQYQPSQARIVVLDGSAADAPNAGVLAQTASALPHQCQVVAWREVAQVLERLCTEQQNRLDGKRGDDPAIFVLIFGLQRYRMLRRSEEDFGFRAQDQQRGDPPDRQFSQLLREGPPVGMHVMAWADTLATVERALDRQSVAEFDHRVLFQMSASDSSNLIDSPEANRLGMYRALLFSEEQGVFEKFRPFAVPQMHWLEDVGAGLRARATQLS